MEVGWAHSFAHGSRATDIGEADWLGLLLRSFDACEVRLYTPYRALDCQRTGGIPRVSRKAERTVPSLRPRLPRDCRARTTSVGVCSCVLRG